MAKWTTPRPLVVRCGLAVLAAFGLFAFLFLRAGEGFWLWLVFSVLVLCAVAFLAEPENLRDEIGWLGVRGSVTAVLAGVGSALLLYAIFFIGNLAVRHLLPFGAAEIEAVYRQGARTPRWIVAGVLLLVVGPGEEIFWRGYVQRRLTIEYGRIGAGLSILAYTGVHVATGNLTLILAAFVCGVFWAVLYRMYASIWINIISHAAWAALVFVWFPLR